MVDFVDLWNSLRPIFFAMLIIFFAFTARIDLIFSKDLTKSTHKKFFKEKILSHW